MLCVSVGGSLGLDSGNWGVVVKQEGNESGGNKKKEKSVKTFQLIFPHSCASTTDRKRFSKALFAGSPSRKDHKGDIEKFGARK